MLLNLTSILFSLIFVFPPGKFVSSCIYKAVGGKVVISFDDAKLQEEGELRWTHNKQKVYIRKGSQIKHSELNVNEDGSLILENVQKDKSGEYKGVIYDAEGKLITETVQELCVLEPVAEPIVLVECVENGVNLNCSAVNIDEVVVSWMKNGKEANMTHAVLHISSSELKPGDTFSCTLRNQISKKSAKVVKPVCSDTDLHATTANEDKTREINSQSENKNIKGKFVSSCVYKAVGGKVVISFDDTKLQEDSELRWTHNKQKVYIRKGSQIKLNNLNVNEDGSLILENVQKDQSGEYKGVIYDTDGKLITETVQQLCVLEPVAEPTVLFECVEKGVYLNCSAMNNDEVVVSWMKNGIKTSATLAFLHVTSSELKPGDTFSCTVSNQISKKSTEVVEPGCSLTDHTNPPDEQYMQTTSQRSSKSQRPLPPLPSPQSHFCVGLP